MVQLMSPCVVGDIKHIKYVSLMEEKELEESKTCQEKFSVSKDERNIYFFFYISLSFLSLFNLFLLWHTFYYCRLLQVLHRTVEL